MQVLKCSHCKDTGRVMARLQGRRYGLRDCPYCRRVTPAEAKKGRKQFSLTPKEKK
jgi:phage FluMu protein Com